MKSRLFNKLSPDYGKTKEIFEDLKIAISLPEEVLVQISNSLESIVGSTNVHRTEEIIKRISSSGHVTEIAIERSLRVIDFILRISASDDFNSDTANDWVSDLISLGFLDDETNEKFGKFLKNVQNTYRNKLKRQVLTKRTVKGVSPYLETINYTIEFRAINSATYKYESDPIEYTPDIQGLTPIVTLRIQLDSGNVKELSFNVNEDAVKSIINCLSASLQEIEAVKQFLNNRGTNVC